MRDAATLSRRVAGRRRLQFTGRATPVIRFLLRVLARLPLRRVQALGAGIGHLLAIIPNDLRRTARINLARCCPELTATQRRRLLRRSLIETGKTATEIGPLWLWDRAPTLALVRSTSGEAAVTDALRTGHGVLLATPHMGAWELAGLYCSAHYPMTVLYAPPRFAGLDEFLQQVRARYGARLATPDAAGVRGLYRTLADGGVVGLLPDQDPGTRGSGLFAPFFGVPAKTTTLPARLARHTGARVVVGFAERLENAAGFHLHFEPVAADFGNLSLAAATARINGAVEACVRKRIEQYQWCYKRFRTPPAGATRLYAR